MLSCTVQAVQGPEPESLGAAILQMAAMPHNVAPAGTRSANPAAVGGEQTILMPHTLP